MYIGTTNEIKWWCSFIIHPLKELKSISCYTLCMHLQNKVTKLKIADRSVVRIEGKKVSVVFSSQL